MLNLSLTSDEFNNLAQLVDLGVKSAGSQAVLAAAPLLIKFSEAAQAAQAEAAAPVVAE